MQIAMTGEDWLSGRDVKRQARAEAVRKKAANACARKLEAAAESLREYLISCRDCNDGSGSKGIDDSRLLLVDNLMEYKCFLETRYG